MKSLRELATLAAAGLMLTAWLLVPRPSRAEDQNPPAGKAEAAKPDGDFIGAAACLSCHADKEGFHKNIHARAWPKAKGIAFEQSCETCHGSGARHAAAGGDKNNADFFTIRNPKKMKPAEVTETCLECHSGGKRMHWQGSIHEAKNVQCTNCHSMHDEKANGGKEPLLTRKSEAETCFQCHAEKKAQIRKSAHMPIVEGKMGCTGCHNPHGSTTEKLLAKNSVPETCYKCHQDKRGPFVWEHPPVRENCLSCHDPHGSHNDFMLVTKPPLLCQRCHAQGAGHPATDYGLDQEFSTNQVKMFAHACVNCHNRIHGSNHPSGKRLTR